MRLLTQPPVLKSAAIAAIFTALACFPRLALWDQRSRPLWYLELALLLCSSILWAFVFAWYPEHTRRPAFRPPRRAGLWALATCSGVAVAALLHWLVDPQARAATPQDYPTDFGGWLASTAFTLSFNLLFLTLAPVALLLRLLQRRAAVVTFTVLLGVFMMYLKMTSSPESPAPELLVRLLAARVLIGALAASLFLEGGVWLAWWWALLLQGRHLLTLAGG